jgi:hypothetical protein
MAEKRCGPCFIRSPEQRVEGSEEFSATGERGCAAYRVDNCLGRLSTFNVKLREHPLMFFRGHHNWPPVWSSLREEEDKHFKGEMGTLKKVEVRDVADLSVCFLWMEHEAEQYIGCFVFTDASFARLVSGLLEVHLGHSIEEIGGLEIGDGTLH